MRRRQASQGSRRAGMAIAAFVSFMESMPGQTLAWKVGSYHMPPLPLPR